MYCRCQDQVCNIRIYLSQLQYILVLMELMWLHANKRIDGVMLYSVPKGRSERRENVSEICVVAPYIGMYWVSKLFLFIQNASDKQFVFRMYWECFRWARNLVSNTEEAIRCYWKQKLHHQCCISKTILTNSLQRNPAWLNQNWEI